MKSRLLRRIRIAAAAVFCGAVAVIATSPSSGAAPKPQAPVQFVSLQGEGAWSITSELVSWQNELASANPWINLNYVKHGSFLGREDLIAGSADFAISGVPFTQQELSHVKGGASAFIEAPVQVATAATYVVPPPLTHFRFITQLVQCDPTDPSTWPPTVTDGSQCVVEKPLDGPLRITSRNLAAMLLHYPQGGFPPLTAWNNPDELKALGVTGGFRIETGGNPEWAPIPAGRSDPDEFNYYVQNFAKTGAADVWQGLRASNPNAPWEPISERMGQVAGSTRDGAEQQIALLLGGNCAASCFGSAGGIAEAPPSMIAQFRQEFPTQPVMFAELQNANGEWVGPTVDAIDKAVNAGGNTPLYALTNKVAGAYPFVWVDHLYAPAHGLSIEKTEGIAMTIRYLATTGQEKERQFGDGQLSPALVAQALDAANQLVRSNCVGNDRTIVQSSDPGPLAPPTATAMKSIGTMLHCEAATPNPTNGSTTTTIASASSPTVGTPGFNSASGFDSGGGSSFGPGGSSGTGSSSNLSGASAQGGSGPGGSSARGPTGSSGTGRNALLTASKLPLDLPAGATGTDRLAAFLLGAGLYLIVRKPLGRLLPRIAT
jgi:hypothetical protein